MCNDGLCGRLSCMIVYHQHNGQSKCVMQILGHDIEL